MPFDNNVFINCPFDAGYRRLLKALLFTTVYLEFEPQIAQTKSSSQVRITQIKEAIKSARYSIHDLSRSRPSKRTELPRFNMPYELGLDIGCAEFGGSPYHDKKILVLEKDRYHYHKVISDFSGQDIENHNDNPQLLIRKVRNWFSVIDEVKEYPGSNEIWISYNQFTDDLSSELLRKHYTAKDIRDMPAGDFIKFAKIWFQKFTS